MKETTKEKNLYDPAEDAEFSEPYIDQDEWRELPVRHRYIHGGFNGTKTRFCFYFPETEKYEGRFFQKLDPVQGPETEAQLQEGEEDSISFSVLHGGYFVGSNMGGELNGGGDPSLLYRSCSACAEYSRKIAVDMYGGSRPYGYLFGGSGGAFKTVSCVEMTKSWDGAVPFVMGSPMSIPNMFTVRAHAMRILRHKMEQITDAVEPGGSGNPYAGLTGEETEALREWLGMGFPVKTLCEYETIGEGALPVLTPVIYAFDPEYPKDFWTKPGYLGADPEGSAVRDRICFRTVITGIFHAERDIQGLAESIDEKNAYGVDEAWKHAIGKSGRAPALTVEEFPSGSLYCKGLKMRFLTGGLEGEEISLIWLGGNVVTGEGDASGRDMCELMKKIAVGDQVEIDNSDYIAFQTYHRHQVPDKEFYVWDQFRNESGEPVYPQRPLLLGPVVAKGGAGSIQQGIPNCRIIVLESLMDESAFPWQADWYRRKVAENMQGEERERMRLWYMENCMHTDCSEGNGGDHQHIVSYLGALHQALLDVALWVEKGVEPAESTSYQIRNGQVIIDESADRRKGIQPVVRFQAGDARRMEVRCKERVDFTVQIEIPKGAGEVSSVLWDFEKTNRFEPGGELVQPVQGEEGVTVVTVKNSWIFENPGTYFPVVKAAVNRKKEDFFTNVWNQDRIRVIVV